MDTTMFLVVSFAIYLFISNIAIAVVIKTEVLGKKEDMPSFWECFPIACLTFIGPYCIIMLPFACKKLLGKWGNIVELTIWSMVFTIFFVWGAYLEYTLWTRDGIIDRLLASTLTRIEVWGWIFFLNSTIICVSGLVCGLSGARIYWLLKSKKEG